MLDVATGDGHFAQYLAECLKNYRTVIGIDTRRSAIQAARRRNRRRRVRFRVMDAAHLKFPAASFDVVGISFSLHHLADPKRVLREMLRVLKPGGWLVIREMHRDHQPGPRHTHVLAHHFWARIDSHFGMIHRPTSTHRQLVNLGRRLRLDEKEIFDYAPALGRPRSLETRKAFFKHIDESLVRMKGDRTYARLRRDAQVVKRRLRTVGLAPPASVVILGRKPEGRKMPAQ